MAFLQVIFLHLEILPAYSSLQIYHNEPEPSAEDADILVYLPKPHPAREVAVCLETAPLPSFEVHFANIRDYLASTAEFIQCINE